VSGYGFPLEIGREIQARRMLNHAPTDDCIYEYVMRYRCRWNRINEDGRPERRFLLRQVRYSTTYLLEWEYTMLVRDHNAREMATWEKRKFADATWAHEWVQPYGCNGTIEIWNATDTRPDQEEDDEFTICNWCPLGAATENPYAPAWWEYCPVLNRAITHELKDQWRKARDPVLEDDLETARLPLGFPYGGRAAYYGHLKLNTLYEEARKGGSK